MSQFMLRVTERTDKPVLRARRQLLDWQVPMPV